MVVRVGFDDTCLQLRHRHDVILADCIVRHQASVQLRIADGGGLDHLHQPVDKLRLRERGEERRLDDRELGGIEMADAVLHAAEVYGRLATDGGIDHGEERRRHVDMADAALVAGGHEAAEVAHRAAAEAHQHRLPVGTRLEQRLPHLRGHLEALALLAHRYLDKIGLLERIDFRHECRQAVFKSVLVEQDSVARIVPRFSTQHAVQRHKSAKK